MQCLPTRGSSRCSVFRRRCRPFRAGFGQRGPKFGVPNWPTGAEVSGTICTQSSRSPYDRRISDFFGKICGIPEIRISGFRQQSATAVNNLRRPFFDVAVASWVRRFRPKTGSEIRGSKLARRRRGLGGQPLRKSGKFGPTRASAISRKKSGNLKIQTSEFRRQFVGEVYNLAAPRFLT